MPPLCRLATSVVSMTTNPRLISGLVPTHRAMPLNLIIGNYSVILTICVATSSHIKNLKQLDEIPKHNVLFSATPKRQQCLTG